jgi:Ca-activated chloride channel homolog
MNRVQIGFFQDISVAPIVNRQSSIAMGDVMVFQWPLLLISLAVIPALIISYLLIQRRRKAYTLRFTNLNLLSTVVGQGPGVRRHVPPVIYTFGLAVLLLSLARPTAIIPVPQNQTSVMLVLDVSGSMEATDLQPNRMVAARQAARALVESLPPDLQVGVVSFNSGASLAAPLTRDRAVVLQAIDRLRANGGTAIGEGLNLALDQLERAERAQTPTQGQGAATAASRAAQEGVKVYTVGIGQRGAAPSIPGARGVQRLDERTLQSIAEQTSGQYYYAAETKQLQEVYKNLGSQVSWVEERTEITAFFSALGVILLLVGGGLSLRWFGQVP